MITLEISKLIDFIKETYSDSEKTIKLFENSITNTLETTIKPQEDGTTFVITGDIPAMWLRDSVAQIRPLLLVAKEDETIFKLIRGVIELQKRQVLIDPYANAFNLDASGEGHHDDLTDMKPELWERKYEIDSLCYPVQLAYLFWKSTDDATHFDAAFLKMAKLIVQTFKTEQHHEEKSNYRFERDNDWLRSNPDRKPFETLPREGKGSKTAYTGMTWSGFRPSDDACKYGYLVPSNMFAVVILRYMVEIIEQFYQDENAFVVEIEQLIKEINQGIETHAIVDHPILGKMYAYEVDGLGNHHLMDDANVPSLLSLPYLGYCAFDDPIYLNTRRFVLSKENPYYYEGKYAKGIGSPHTPTNYIWHIALSIQGLTSIDEKEKAKVLETLITTDADTNLLHEGFNVDNPFEFTRPWFSWSNSMFAEFLLSLNGLVVKGSPLDREVVRT